MLFRTEGSARWALTYIGERESSASLVSMLSTLGSLKQRSTSCTHSRSSLLTQTLGLSHRSCNEPYTVFLCADLCSSLSGAGVRGGVMRGSREDLLSFITFFPLMSPTHLFSAHFSNPSGLMLWVTVYTPLSSCHSDLTVVPFFILTQVAHNIQNKITAQYGAHVRLSFV